MPTTDPDKLLGTHVRWWLVAFFVALGVLFILGGAFFSADVFGLGDSEAAYWSGVAGNIGSTLLLAALLVWFERRFTGRVHRVARAAAAHAASAMMEEMAKEMAGAKEEAAAEEKQRNREERPDPAR